MKIQVCLISIALLTMVKQSNAITADEILAAMDKNRTYGTVSYNGTMEIHIGDDVRTKQMKVTGVGDSKALVEFTNPSDEGVKYLKINKDLWIYFPSEQDMVKISGHLLNEGMMGSDVSYEDALESDAVKTKYNASIEKEEVYENSDCWVLLLDAKVKEVPYFKRRMWIDKKLFTVHKEEMYAKSGKLLKQSKVLETVTIGSRHFPSKVEMENKLRNNSRTVFTMTNIKFDVKVSDNLFSLQNLQR
jgi:outer membrane lipoprotein-sorting protein